MNDIITIKTDKATKKASQKLAKEMGLTLSDLINNYLKQIVTSQYIEILPEPMTPKLEKLLQKAETEISKGQVSRPYDNIEDCLKDLHSDKSL